MTILVMGQCEFFSRIFSTMAVHNSIFFCGRLFYYPTTPGWEVVIYGNLREKSCLYSIKAQEKFTRKTIRLISFEIQVLHFDENFI